MTSQDLASRVATSTPTSPRPAITTRGLVLERRANNCDSLFWLVIGTVHHRMIAIGCCDKAGNVWREFEVFRIFGASFEIFLIFLQIIFRIYSVPILYLDLDS